MGYSLFLANASRVSECVCGYGVGYGVRCGCGVWGVGCGVCVVCGVWSELRSVRGVSG